LRNLLVKSGEEIVISFEIPMGNKPPVTRSFSLRSSIKYSPEGEFLLLFLEELKTEKLEGLKPTCVSKIHTNQS